MASQNAISAKDEGLVSLEQIYTAQQRLQGIALPTPLLLWPDSTESQRLYLKTENLQPVGAFKIRGAYNFISSIDSAERKRGLIAHSSGNHAQGVAYVARALGVEATIVLPNTVSKAKADAVRALGAHIISSGPNSSDRIRQAEELALKHGYVLVPPYDDLRVIAANGTIGLEILRDLPDCGLVLVPISGGGLISGIAAAIKQCRPDCRVVGVEPELAADAQASLKAGRRIAFDFARVNTTVADALRTTPVGKLPFEHIRRFVDDIVTVTEEEIFEMVKRLLFKSRLLAEPGGAVAAAAWIFHRDKLPSAYASVAIVSGGNIEPELLEQILAGKHDLGHSEYRTVQIRRPS